MAINLTDPANHPANGPLTVERIIRVREELRRSLEYQNGGDMAYVIADAIKGLEELLVSREAVPVMYCSQETIAASKDGEHLLRTLSTPSGDCVIPLYAALPAPTVPETLPCPVLLEPGLRFGKGVKTQLLFDALSRRAEYCAELDAMTPEQRTDREVGLNNLRNALGIEPLENHEMALLLSKEVISQSFGNAEQLDTENGRDELPYDPQIAEYEKIMQQAEPDGWIPVSERLPDDTVDADGGATCYLVLYADGKQPSGGSNVQVSNVTYLRRWHEGMITHWQPLPAAPKEVGDNIREDMEMGARVTRHRFRP